MRRWLLRVLAASSVLVAVLLAVAVNAATATLPSFLDHHPGRAWILVAILVLASIGLAVLSARADEPNPNGGPGAGMQVGGVHAGRDLTIGGDHNIVAGGEYMNGKAPDPRESPGPARPARRRDRR